jgi:hypothetical protein
MAGMREQAASFREQIDRRFDQVDERFKLIGGRFDRMHSEMLAMERRIEQRLTLRLGAFLTVAVTVTATIVKLLSRCMSPCPMVPNLRDRGSYWWCVRGRRVVTLKIDVIEMPARRYQGQRGTRIDKRTYRRTYCATTAECSGIRVGCRQQCEMC